MTSRVTGIRNGNAKSAGLTRARMLYDNFSMKPSRPAAHRLLVSLGLVGFATHAALGAPEGGKPADTLHTFTRHQLTDQFWGEGAAFGDFNKDGKMDVVSGPFWYEGPSFKERHAFMPADRVSKSKRFADGAPVEFPGFKGGLGNENEYSANFIAYTHDLNRDGWTDILILGFPGENSWWFENPGKGSHAMWKQHIALDVTDNESPHFVDITGDGRPEIVCASKGYYGYVRP